MKKLLLLSACLLLFAGCFETDFDFKTIVKPNGSVVRETKIDGRGADRFLPPSGKGWQVKTYETRGGESILEDTYYHIQATGRFQNVGEIGSDYQFDAEKQFKQISDEERKNFVALGIVEPFDESVFSKNHINVVKHRGIFKSIFEYQEVFQNKGIIQLLLNDIKKEVIREQSVLVPSKSKDKEPSETPAQKAEGDTQAKAEDAQAKEEVKEVVAKETSPVTIEGALLSSQVVESVAEERMQKEVLSKFIFRSEVTLPGEIVSSNAGSFVGSTAVWKFSLADFRSNYSHYILTARSQVIEWRTIVLLIVLLLIILFGASFIKIKQPTKKRSSKSH